MEYDRGENTMKPISSLCIIVCFSMLYAKEEAEHSKPAIKDIELNIVPQWHSLDANKESCEQFGGAWIEAGVITLRKRTKEPISMTHLILSWQGEELEHLIGSLYQSIPNKDFMPIEQYLICDSHWQQSGQKLIFKFLKPLSLESLTELRLVLTVPMEMHEKLKQGSLKVEADYMPDQIREMLQNQSAVLTFHDCGAGNTLS